MMTKGMGIALLSAAALLGGAAAQAGELPWTYGEVGYTKAPGTEDFDTDAYDLKGSIGFLDKWHSSLQYTEGTTDFDSSSDDDFDGWRLVVGAHPQLTPDTQLVTEISYFDYNYDGGEGSDGGADGFGLGLGLRHSLSDKAELSALATYTQANFDDSGFGSSGNTDVYSTVVEVGGRYNWMPNLSTGLTVSLGGGGAGAGLESSFLGGNLARFDVRWSFLGDVSK